MQSFTNGIGLWIFDSGWSVNNVVFVQHGLEVVVADKFGALVAHAM
jgi:hypothetical protein